MSKLSQLFITAQNGITNRGGAIEELFDLYFSEIPDDERENMKIVVDHPLEAYGIVYNDFLLLIPKAALELLCDYETQFKIIEKAVPADFDDISGKLNAFYYNKLQELSVQHLLYIFNRAQEYSKIRYKIFQELLIRDSVVLTKGISRGKEFLEIAERSFGPTALVGLIYIRNNEVRKVLEKMAYH